MTTPISRAEDLYSRVRSCLRCPLADTRTNAVPGEGPLNADVLFVGEAPGMNEDKQGRPFVGQAGQFLEELLAAAGLIRQEVYICNVLKCRPPANRDPAPDEVIACRDYLDEQIDLVDPLVVVTLGRFSMAKWFQGQTISRIHGTVNEIDGRFVIPMFHPAAALHQQNLRPTIITDFRTVPAVLERARRLRARQQLFSHESGLTPLGGHPSAAPGADHPSTTTQQQRLFD
ncbi:MAG: uracil-DNA glycosylase [Anaerolineaceae bacterium]